MTQQELDAIRGIVQQETRAIVQEETRAIVQEETRAIIQKELEPIHERLDNMQDQINDIKDQLDEMQEDTQITRGAVNALCEWADHVAIVTAVTFPVKKAE